MRLLAGTRSRRLSIKAKTLAKYAYKAHRMKSLNILLLKQGKNCYIP